MRCLSALVCGMLLVVSPLGGAAAAVRAAPEWTLGDVMSAPVASALVAARAADRIAWVSQQRGARSVWTAAAPDFMPLALAEYAADDGRPLGGLTLSADGSVLLFVRGGGPNPAGEHPNPDSDPDGAEQAIWAVSTAGGAAWKVAAGGGPVIAPDGGWVALARGGTVLRVDLRPPGRESPAAEPETLWSVRGGVRGLTFSPDGSRLAFVSDRGDHAFIGVFDLAARRLVWMAPDVDRDGFPAFSRDGRRLAFLRQPGSRMGELFDLTAGVPFAVWVGDPATGAAEQVWRSPGDDGGYAQYYPGTALAWSGDDRLLLTSEHEGWLHVYALTPGRAAAVDLTPGPGEVESFGLSPDGMTLLFWGNHGDLHRRRVFRRALGAADAEVEALSPESELAFEPVALPGGALAYRASTARLPPRIRLLGAGPGGAVARTLEAPPLPERFPLAELVEPRVVTFRSADGVEIGGQLFLPPAAAGGQPVDNPAVIFLHGGPVRQMLPGWHYRGYYANAYAFNQYLASRGYVVLALNFRCGMGYGRAFRQAAEQGPRGASEYRDVVAAGRWLAARAEVDPRRIGLWGGSYGGYLTALGLARDSVLFAAGVDLHGVHDWAWRGEHFHAPGGVWGLSGDAVLEVARRASPVADLSLWSSPVLFVHGDDDRNVDFIQTTDLVQRLRQRNRQLDEGERFAVEVLVFPDEVHGFLRYASWRRTFEAAASFFDRHLGPAMAVAPEGGR